MHANRIHVPSYCAYEELRAAGDSSNSEITPGFECSCAAPDAGGGALPALGVNDLRFVVRMAKRAT